MEESNKRFLTSSLVQIEKNLQEIKNMLLQNEPRSLFTVIIDDVEPKDRKSIIGFVDAALDEIRKIKESFDLESSVTKKSTHILVQLSSISLILDDLSPKNLESYGKMNWTDKDMINSHLVKIKNMLDAVKVI